MSDFTKSGPTKGNERRGGGRAAGEQFGSNAGRGGRGRGSHDGGFQGRGNGRDSREARGRNPGEARRNSNQSMKEVPLIQDLFLENKVKAREAILQAISASGARRNCPVEVAALPTRESWRLENPIGISLPSDAICTNHFRVNWNHLPPQIFQYSVAIFKIVKTKVQLEDIAKKVKPEVSLNLIRRLFKRHDWTFAPIYDEKSQLFTATQLPMPRGKSKLEETIGITDDEEGLNETNKTFKVIVTPVETLTFPPPNSPEWKGLAPTLLTVLNASVVSFARWMKIKEDPSWFHLGNKVFFCEERGALSLIGGAYLAQRGFHASFRSLLDGTLLNVDVSVNIFLSGGPMLELARRAAGCNSVADFLGGFRSRIKQIDAVIKDCKIRLIHLHRDKKAVKLGPPANSRDSEFDFVPGDGKPKRRVTVEQYFRLQYPHITLRYPGLPTIQIGTGAKKALIPMELVFVKHGQPRTNLTNPEITAKVIRHAAISPNDRIKFIKGQLEGQVQTLFSVLQGDATAVTFGTNSIDVEPIRVPAHLIPPPELKYRNNASIDPDLNGHWDPVSKKCQFVRPPSDAAKSGEYLYSFLAIGESLPISWEGTARRLCIDIEAKALTLGFKLKLSPNCRFELFSSISSLKDHLCSLQSEGVRFPFCVLLDDRFPFGRNDLKLITDSLGMVSQCLNWEKIKDGPSPGYLDSLLTKLHSKLGGVNHELNTPVFNIFGGQSVMFLGIDVSHADRSERDGSSVAAVVASMNKSLTDYTCDLSEQSGHQEMVADLQDAVSNKLQDFRNRNKNAFPRFIVVVRDGVSEGQFQQVIDQELPQIETAIELHGFPKDYVKIAIVVCQKRHKTRLVFADESNELRYLNPCPGLLVDGRNDAGITSARYPEFYLNSHIAIQGTAKPCKYTLIYDEIGFLESELQLLMYYSTYLYGRCNRSVSYPTPAYYAHWASKRGKELVAAGATSDKLKEISRICSEMGKHAGMFFL